MTRRQMAAAGALLVGGALALGWPAWQSWQRERLTDRAWANLRQLFDGSIIYYTQGACVPGVRPGCVDPPAEGGTTCASPRA